MSEDDDLGIDLDAWEAPPPPSGIADAVLARLQGTNVNIAVPPLETERPVRRWWLLGGGLAAAAVAAGTLLVVGLRDRPPANGSGDVDATQPHHLALGPSTAELDAGTHVTWRRDRDQLSARQARGAATWRVGDDDTLTIDAVLASIEASNASLRVEVQMQPDDEKRERTKQTIATSAATAAAVALVTVIVYDGAARVTHAGKATQVAAGTTYQIRGDAPAVIEEEITVAGTPRSDDVAKLQAELERKEREIAELRRKLDDEEARVPMSEAPELPEQLERAAISAGVAKIKSQVAACGRDYDGRIKVRVRVGPDGRVTHAFAEPADANPSACIVRVFDSAKFAQTQHGGSFAYPYVFTAERQPCDAAAPLAEGTEAFSMGDNAKALAKLEIAYRCDPKPRTLQLAFAAACKSRAMAQAKRLWKRMTPTMRQSVMAFCPNHGITIAQLEDRPGRLRVVSKPSTRILVDGVARGVTPLDLELAPGKHKVTLIHGHDKHTFSVTVKPGETTTLSRDL